MEVSLTREDLAKALSIVGKVVSPRPSLPVLSNVYLKAKKEGLELAATDLETAIRLLVPAKVTKEGETTAPARVLADFVTSSSEEKLAITLVKDNLEVTGTNSKALLSTINAVEYPPIPTQKATGLTQTDKSELAGALNQVIFAASVDEARPVLTGILFRQEEGGLLLVATDGYRLVRKKTKISLPKTELIIPSRSLAEVIKTISDQEDEKIGIGVVEEKNQIIFSSKNFEISSRLLEGTFPNFEQIIPQKFISSALVNKDALIKAVRQASTLARDLGNVVQLEVGPKDQIVVSAKTAQLGQAEAKLSAKVKGEGVKIAFNSKYLLDGLSIIGSDELVISFSGATNPTLIESAQDKSLSYVVMPVRIQG